MDSQRTILVIGSDDRETHRVQQCIEQAGYDAIVAHDAGSGLRELYSRHPNAAILLMDAVDWPSVERMRESCDTPMILVASQATRSSVQHAFDLGLDGYLVKPLQPGELVGRLTAAVQKVSNAQSSHSDSPCVFRHKALTIDRRKMEVQLGGEPVHLSPTEFKLLSFLAERCGWVVSYDEILTEVWGPAYVGCRNHVKLYVWYLRRKLEADPADPRWIRTKHGVGYIFGADEMLTAGAGHASNH